MTSVYSHFYSKRTEEDSKTAGNCIREKITSTFPNAYARLSPYVCGLKNLAYRIPTFCGGLNELTIKTGKYSGDGKPVRNIVDITITSVGLFGDRINRTLKKTLDDLRFEENTKIGCRFEVTDDELQSQERAEFHLATANDMVTEVIAYMERPASKSICIDNISSPDLGEYLQLMTVKQATKHQVSLFTKYDPKFRRFEVKKKA